LQPSHTNGVNSIFVTALPPSAGSGSSSSIISSSSSTFGSGPSARTSSSTDGSDGIPSSSTSINKDSQASSLMARGLLQPQQITSTSSAVGEYFWTTDGTGIVFVVDSGSGSEDYHLYWVPLTASNGTTTSSSSSSGSSSGEGGSNQPGDVGVTVTPGSAVNLTPFKGTRDTQAEQ
jgi:hypothetical protein